MREFVLLFSLVGSIAWAECPTGNCGSNSPTSQSSQPSQPLCFNGFCNNVPSTAQTNLPTVQDGGSFQRAEGSVQQCGSAYERCVAPGPEMIESCSETLRNCINGAQANLPPGYR